MANILIVDDSAIQRGRMREALRTQGHDVREAGDGREALTVLEGFAPECILLDLMMPEMGGLEFLRGQAERGRRTPTVVLHTDFPESTQEACRLEGAIDFLLKPIDEKELQSVVREALAAHAARTGGNDSGRTASAPISVPETGSIEP